MTDTVSPNRLDIHGVWKSHYRFPSSSREKEFEIDYYVRAHRVDGHIVFATVPGTSSSYVVVRLYFDELVGTGSWQEETDPEGYYKGAVYHGAIQVVASEDHKHLKGQWVGFGKNMQVNTGPWEFTYVGEDLPPDVPTTEAQ